MIVHEEFLVVGVVPCILLSCFLQAVECRLLLPEGNMLHMSTTERPRETRGKRVDVSETSIHSIEALSRPRHQKRLLYEQKKSPASLRYVRAPNLGSPLYEVVTF